MIFYLYKKSILFHRSDGQVQISTTVPDTITSWIASAFAINNASGLGIADTTAKVHEKKILTSLLKKPF